MRKNNPRNISPLLKAFGIRKVWTERLWNWLKDKPKILVIALVLIVSAFLIWNYVFDEQGCINLGCINRYQCIREGQGTKKITNDYLMSVHWVKYGFCDEINTFQACGSDCSGVLLSGKFK